MNLTIQDILSVAIALCCAGMPFSGVAQTDQEAPDTTKRSIYLTFDLDIGLEPLSSSLRDRYKGPRYERNQLSPEPPEWQWVDRDTTASELQDDYKLRSYKLNTSLIVWNNLNFGVTYHLFFLLDRETGNIGNSIPNFAIGGLLGYDYSPDFLKGGFIHPSVSFGGYQSNNYYEGVGQEWYFNGKIAVGYRLNNHVGARLFVANNFFLYRNEEESEKFNRTSQTKIDISMLQFGAGLTYRFTIDLK